MEARIEELEIRAAHQERALDDLAAHVLAQQERIDALSAQVRELHALVRTLAPSDVARPQDEGPPPHY